MLFIQSAKRNSIVTLENIAQCQTISLEKNHQGQFCIKFYSNSGSTQGTTIIKYSSEKAAMNDFEDLKKSLKEHRFVWESSEEGHLVL